MIKLIVNEAFVSQKTGLSFDISLDRIEIDGDGFTVHFTKLFKDTDGAYSEEAAPKKDVIFIPKADKLNLYNNVTGDMGTKLINKFTP